jgi:hypothetical protein
MTVLKRIPKKRDLRKKAPLTRVKKKRIVGKTRETVKMMKLVKKKVIVMKKEVVRKVTAMKMKKPHEPKKMNLRVNPNPNSKKRAKRLQKVT